MRSTIALTIAALALSSCIHSRQVKLTGCDHPSGWSDQIRAMAVETYPYAQMAVNAYEGADPFAPEPGWIKIDSKPNNTSGMAYDVWSRQPADGGLHDVVLAFRGTEFTHLSDWRHGNFGTRQNADGVEAFRDWRRRYPHARFAVAGHSLGGGIATQISLTEADVRSFIFNSSPRFKAPSHPQVNARVSVAERGEILKAARLLGREATQDYFSLNCRGGDPGTQHGSPALARCLTQIASWQNESAKDSLERNQIPLALPAARPGTADCRRRR